MKKFNLFGSISIFALLFLIANPVSAQNVGIGTNTPNPAAKLEVTSTNSGFLPPRMTFAERNAIVNPVAGLIIWCSDCDTSGQLQVYNGSRWTNFIGGVASEPIANLPSVTIGTQIWSSKNLDVAYYRNGDPIPHVTDSSQWTILATGAWCWYNNDSATYAATYGKLYNWYAVNDPRGLAPQGWRVPNETEWNKLVKYLDPATDTACLNCTQSAIVGGAMKSIAGWSSPNIGATNSSGFAGFPAGCRYPEGVFFGAGNIGVWWSAEDVFAMGEAFFRSLNFNDSDIYRASIPVNFGFSVRVVRD